jgi:hypothetical protein
VANAQVNRTRFRRHHLRATQLNASELTISQDLTIDGSALAAQISLSGDSDNNGTGNVRVLTVNSGTITLDSLTITKGSSTTAGGLRNRSGDRGGRRSHGRLGPGCNVIRNQSFAPCVKLRN